MSDLVPAADASLPAQPSLLSPLSDPAGGSVLTRLKSFSNQAPVRRMLPWFIGVSALGALALTWSTIAPSPQRTLYSQLDDNERASVVDALDKASIPYSIDNQTGALTVADSDFYRARMLVASDGALATPESGADMLDKLPMGASRALEGERLRAAREHDLMLTIQEIDGVESVRVHLAEGEKSVFVRDNLPPSGSVMLRLGRGRQLSETQVAAIVNLVAGSVPGLTPDAVRVVDQHGQLLSAKTSADSDRLELQARMEDKLRNQVSTLLTPMLGDGNFSTEIQVELDMDQVTSARESYDKDGVVRSETQQASQATGANGQAVGVPGVLSNTPPPAATAQPGPPQGTKPTAPASPSTTGESSSTRTYELGREVAVANTTPGKVKRISVAVAVQGAKKADIDQIKQLVSAAVGADPARGDQVAVVARSFQPAVDNTLPFYEAPWFATVLRSAVSLIAVVLVLVLGVRPLINAFKPKPGEASARGANGEGGPIQVEDMTVEAVTNPESGKIDAELLTRQVSMAQRLISEKPDDAVTVLRQMLNQPAAEPAR